MSPIALAESGWLPDWLLRVGIRRLLRKRIARSGSENGAESFVDLLRSSPLAVRTEAANTQHYEVSAEFFQPVLGPRLKYSCCLYEDEKSTLAEAEEAMLRLTCERAELSEGQRILELGCGWGSLTLWMAQRYPSSSIVAVSNSNSQREYIQARAAALGLKNLRVVTADVVDYAPEGVFDRIVSVEMFEHLRNYELLFRRLAGWLSPGGKVFAHVFCHTAEPYLFETEGADDWMGRHFFTGGTMPSVDLFERFDADLCVTRRWEVSGVHYWRTCEDWLRNLDRSRPPLLRVLRRAYAADADARVALQRWRIFFLACAELFRYSQGERWIVAHYLLEPVEKAAVVNGPPLKKATSP